MNTVPRGWARGFTGFAACAVLGAAAVATAVSGSAGAATADLATAPYHWRLPLGFAAPSVPQDNPMNEAKVALGERLFADPRLSVTGKYSCQSCHAPAAAFTDGRALSRGATGEELPLNAPTLWNAAYNASFGWRDPTVRSLEQQMHGPLFNEHPPELGLRGHEAQVERSLLADESLRSAFTAAFPQEVRPLRMDNVIRAIAAYERTLIAADSPFDRYVFAGEHAALTAVQKRGMELFFTERAGCARCHGGLNFAGDWSDAAHPGAAPAFADTGTGSAVRVPTLRNLRETAPYMHDGRFATLQAVLEHYERQASNPGADARLRRSPLTTEERAALREFLGALESPAARR